MIRAEGEQRRLAFQIGSLRNGRRSWRGCAPSIRPHTRTGDPEPPEPGDERVQGERHLPHRAHAIGRLLRPAVPAHRGKYGGMRLDENYQMWLYDQGGVPAGTVLRREVDLANLCLRLAISRMIMERSGNQMNYPGAGRDIRLPGPVAQAQHTGDVRATAEAVPAILLHHAYTTSRTTSARSARSRKEDGSSTACWRIRFYFWSTTWMRCQPNWVLTGPTTSPWRG